MNPSTRGLIERFANTHVVVIGDVMLDEYLWGRVNRISPEAPIPIVDVDHRSAVAGGAGNVAANIAALGGRVSIVSVVGDDSYGRQLAAALEAAGVAVGGLHADPERPTTVKTRIVAHNQQVVRVDREVRQPIGQASADEIERAFAELVGQADVVLLSDYDKGVLGGDTARTVIGMARQADVPVLVDPKGTDYTKYRGATLLTPNLGEAAQATRRTLSDDDAIASAAAELMRAVECQAVLVTCGEAGMWLFERERPPAHFGSRAREVYDVTGAGDTVVGVFALAMASNATFEVAARVASEAAGIVVGKVGTATLHAAELAAALGESG